MKSTKRFSFYKTGWMALILICTMFYSFCQDEHTISSYAYTKTTGVVKPESAKIRSEANTSSESVAGVKQSEELTIVDETKDSAGNIWYKVTVDNTTGYIRADLVTKGKSEAPKEETPKTTETKANVTASSISSGTITEVSVNVRKGPAATDAVVASAKKGTVVSITGETQGGDQKIWYQVSFLNNNKEVTGYIRADLLESSPEKPEEPTEPEGTTVEETTEEVEPQQPENYSEISNVVGSRIIPEGTDISQMGLDESILLEWQSGNYYLLYTKGTDGVEAWYLYDVAGDSYQKIENLVPKENADESTEKNGVLGESGKLIVIVLAVLLILMLILCTLLFLKLRAYKGGTEEDEDDEDEDENDEEDNEEEDQTRVKRSRWKSRNFLKSEEDDEEEEEDEDEDDDDDEEDEEVSVKPTTKKQSSKPVAKETPKFQMDLDDEDDEFEFGFLNMDGKGDL